MKLYKNILVPTDFSKYADHAMRYAKALAKAGGGTVHFAHVIDQRVVELTGVEGVYVSPGDIQASVDSLQKHAEEKMGQLKTKAKAFGVDATTHIAMGRPVDELTRMSKEVNADLVVIATHGRSGFDRLVLGSTCGVSGFCVRVTLRIPHAARGRMPQISANALAPRSCWRTWWTRGSTIRSSCLRLMCRTVRIWRRRRMNR